MKLTLTNRPAIQAHRRSSGRFRVPWPTSFLLEKQGQQAGLMGFRSVFVNAPDAIATTNAVLKSGSASRIRLLLDQ